MLYFHQWDPRAEAPRTALRVWTDRWTVGGLYKQHVLIYSSLAVKEKRSYSLAAPANELNNTQPVEREAAAERLAIRRAAGEAWHFQANRQRPRESCDGTLVNAKPGRAKVEKKKIHVNNAAAKEKQVSALATPRTGYVFSASLCRCFNALESDRQFNQSPFVWASYCCRRSRLSAHTLLEAQGQIKVSGRLSSEPPRRAASSWMARSSP